MRDLVQAQLGPDYVVELNKYRFLHNFSGGFIITQVFITLYGLLSMGIVGLMVNALMTTAVNEQKYDLAVLRVLGAPRWRLFEPVVIEVVLLGLIGIFFGSIIASEKTAAAVLARHLHLEAIPEDPSLWGVDVRGRERLAATRDPAATSSRRTAWR